jgi:hypothetical protein
MLSIQLDLDPIETKEPGGWVKGSVRKCERPHRNSEIRSNWTSYRS